MATHQSHNIPWQVLANAVEIQSKYVNVFGAPPRLVDRIIYIREDSPTNPKNFKACEHFTRRFVATISEFSASESKKFQDFNSKKALIYTEKQFDDVLIAGKYQELSYWLNRQANGLELEGSYGFGDLVEIVWRLWERGLISSILCLVRNGFQLDELYGRYYRSSMITYSCLFEEDVWAIMDDCLVIYVTLNLGIAMGWLNDDPQNWPTRMKWICEQAKWARQGHCAGRVRCRTAEFFNQTASASFLAELKAFLRMLFRILYQFDMVWKELGKPVYWTGEVMEVLGNFGIRCTCRFLDEENCCAGKYRRKNCPPCYLS